jgi:hypothetical protein
MVPHRPRNDGSNMITSTSRIKTIARTMTTFMDCLSVPNTIGIGPSRSKPAPRPWAEPRDDRTTRRIIATKASTNPKMINKNPSSVTDDVSNFPTREIDRVGLEL